MKFATTVISSIEFHGKMSLVIFMSTCLLKCPFCHNGDLNEEDKELSEIFKIIDNSLDYIDAVVISGGEPLNQIDDLEKILIYCKSFSLNTKLDTSGVYPDKLKRIIKLVDYIAIDVKAPFKKYEKVIGEDIGWDVKESIGIANKSENTYVECRTTYVPSLISHEDIEEIAKTIKADEYTIQQFRNQNVLDKKLENVENPDVYELQSIAIKVKKYFKVVKIKSAEFGLETVD
ncbi:MAG: anaerobic ribonucleoside-triphosphate reductase activating protein [Methanobrevibacter sp.]|nr:anaerobic ribonucleoside-triphosphate reductase activating protein [Methanobrevibacter sp.]